MPIKIILADDHRIIRQSLRALLTAEPDLQVIAEADHGDDLLRLVRELSPDVVIMDLSMPGVSGVEAARAILAGAPGIKIIALTMHHDSHLVMNMLKAGAAGYLLKDCSLEELVQAIRTVMAHKTYLSPGISDVILREFVGGWPSREGSALAILTERERQVLQLLAAGKSTGEIAAKLEISAKTVEAHRKRIMEKSGFHSIAELTKYAIRQGLATLE